LAQDAQSLKLTGPGAARAGNAQRRNAAIATSEHHVIRELAAHGGAFCVAAGIGAIILYLYYWFFEANTENATIALEAYLASCFVVGGAGPTITWMFFWLLGNHFRRQPSSASP
jgi:hypothetical protein